jgi:UDP-glucuronate decarboxylase
MQPDDGRVISNFMVQSLKNKDITIYGDGSQTRSFCYVDDLVDGIIKMMNSRENFVGPLNLGNPAEFTILELAKKIIKLTDSKSNIIYKPLPEDDPKRRKPNIELAKKELKWKPKIQFDKGLKKTINYFERLLNNEK